MNLSSCYLQFHFIAPSRSTRFDGFGDVVRVGSQKMNLWIDGIIRACLDSLKRRECFAMEASSSTSWHLKNSHLLKSKIPFCNRSSITEFPLGV
jgi:hypothetical protein